MELKKSMADVEARQLLGLLRGMSHQLTRLNRRVGEQVGLGDIDRFCLDLVFHQGPIGPGALARLVGLHPATMTGVLNRLERGGWIKRERDIVDRRAVVVRAVPERAGELARLYAGIDSDVVAICADLDPEQLETVATFLRAVTEVGRAAADEFDGPAAGDTP